VRIVSDKRTYQITIHSPHGTQAIEQFRHWLDKVADEASARWGIDIEITQPETEEAATEEFK
jgi:hypothetical protein